jgi:hypothetical protein
MKYETPFIQSVGSASELIQGSISPAGDSPGNTSKQPMLAFASSLEE